MIPTVSQKTPPTPVIQSSQAQKSGHRAFKVDPFDYQPLRVGIKQVHQAIAIEYTLSSKQGPEGPRRWHHFIKIKKYTDIAQFGISMSRSGSFQDALKQEIERITDQVYSDHCEYLPPEKIQRGQIEDLVRQILVLP